MTNRFIRYGGFAFGAVLAGIFAVTATTGPARAQDPTLDHFKCYLVNDFEAHSARVKLHDQFDDALGRTEDVNVLDPMRFCNPADKRFRGTIRSKAPVLLE